MDERTRLLDCPTDVDPLKLHKLPSILTREPSTNRNGPESGFLSDYSDPDLSFTSFTTTTTNTSARSSLSITTAAAGGARRRPDPLWSAISAVTAIDGGGELQLNHLKLVRRLGSGNLGQVFHCQLKGFDGADFALKVVDRRSASSRKLAQAATEAAVLSTLDHPFLPTLYAKIEASHYSCLLIDYCAGGDLHSILQSRRIPPSAARFYAAEVLVTLEYLHAAGVVYRDLKPENVLIRSDGHVMLSDFDLCFMAEVEPSVEFHEIRRKRRRRVLQAEFSAEPVAARSTVCVGTHEYLAPEVVAGGGHGGGVDWWALGVFLYELLYGRTPFKGATKEATLKNIASKGVRFPRAAVEGKDEAEMAAARDLIRRLLVKDPQRRLGCSRGAQEIKRHPFFAGVDWPLIRCYRPPVTFGASSAVSKMAAEVGLERRRRRRGGWRRWWGCFSNNKGFRVGLSPRRRKSWKYLIL